MKLYYPNHIFSDVTFAGTTNEVATLPKENVGAIHTKKLWRTNGSGSVAMTMTPTASQSFQFFAVIRKTAYTPTQFKYGTSSSSTTTVAYSAMSNYGLIDYYERPNNFAGAQYYTWEWTASANDDTGVIFASPAITLSQDIDSGGLTVEHVDKSSTSESHSGEIFAESGATYRQFKANWSNADNYLKEGLEALYNSVGLHTPFFTQLSTVSPYDEMLYVQLIEPPAFSAGSFGRWSAELTFQDAQ